MEYLVPKGTAILFAAVIFASVGSAYHNNYISNELKNSSLPCAPFLEGHPCQCKASDYKGILECDSERAYVMSGYWVGECGNGTLCTGSCPFGFCTYNGSTDFRLPGTVSELDEFICGDTRTGVLCGECRPGHSVKYHSYIYTCTPDENCGNGWLLYIVSELLPLLVVFIIVVTFNISFTLGAVNSIILYAQLQDSLGIHGNGVIYRHTGSIFYVSIFELLYRFFNIDFFSIEELSFCLWKGATTLDVMAFKYVTIASALVLMLVCVLVVNSSTVKRCLSCLRPTTLRSSLIHGLSTFFVMCYSQCARVSLHILIPMHLYRKGLHPDPQKVVFRSGQLEQFEPTHLRYAIPAIFFSATLLLLPLFFLILYPLLGKLLSCCNLNETKFANLLSRFVPIQLLDSFQSSFRDEVRFFAGFYFLYRSIPLIIFCVCAIYDLVIFYCFLEIFFIFTLALHAIVQPYKKRIHNVVDLLLFANLAIINTFSLLHYFIIVYTKNNLLVLVLVKGTFICLPFVGFVTVCLFRVCKPIVKFLKRKFQSKHEGTSMLTESCDLPPLREDPPEHSKLQHNEYNLYRVDSYEYS